MNEIIQSLFDRKSVRVFLDKHIPDKHKRLILEAAVQAPSAGNQQLYSIIDVTDQSLQEKLAESCDHQPFISTADMVLIFCADFQKWYDLFNETESEPRKPGAGDLILAVTDTMIAAQNAVTAAQSLGIGSCYIGDILEHCEFHRELLSLPDYVIPAGMLVFGYPTEQQLERNKPPRPDINDIVMENHYIKKSGETLLSAFKSNANGREIREWAKAFCDRKYNSDFSREMTRSVEKYLETWLSRQ